ncbi:MAG: XylR N-terminal domain-containing protein [Theionarchaea archaeon]|nr:XylR N-terminal domain-containing protein [Theionarchaea archaeon]MBU7037382.1 XylR N-terminal domain-containing protein [Theionarchaea archaeon]
MTEFKAAGVPPEMVDTFKKAEVTISEFFGNVTYLPERGRIEIDKDRYMWVRADSLAFFRDVLEEVYGEKGADQILYKLGKAVGEQEARKFHRKFGIKDPLEKLSAGPVYFSYSGWAFVNILPASAPSSDESYLLTYHHPGSFEAEHFLASKEKTDRPICHINAGYSAGWCAESFGVPLEAREVTCKAQGDEKCTFLMSHRNTIVQRLQMLQVLLSQGRKVDDLKPEDLSV